MKKEFNYHMIGLLILEDMVAVKKLIPSPTWLFKLNER